MSAIVCFLMVLFASFEPCSNLGPDRVGSKERNWSFIRKKILAYFFDV